MDSIHENCIPQLLLERSGNDEDISIVLGENGSGKTTLLGHVADHFLKSGNVVVAITNSVHDKYNSRSKRFHFLGARHGRSLPSFAIKKALKNISGDTSKRLGTISRGLNHIGYSGEIGIKVNGFDKKYEPFVYEDETIGEEDKDDISKLISKLDHRGTESIIWLEMNDFSFSNINVSVFARLATWENALKRHRIIESISVFLRKCSKTIPLLSASSGELSLISSIIYILTVISPGAVILIDEPENSLHPSWQKNYVEWLLNLLYNFQPKIIIATHSPIIVSGAESTTNKAKIFMAQNGTFELKPQSGLNIEKILYTHFKVLTPQSHFLSTLVVSLLNALSDKKINYTEFASQIDCLKSMSFDGTQSDLLNSSAEIATQIISASNNEK